MNMFWNLLNGPQGGLKDVKKLHNNNEDQTLFGIVQGGMYKDLREKSALRFGIT
jgi:tRNA-guanine family transglycosylase